MAAVSKGPRANARAEGHPAAGQRRWRHLAHRPAWRLPLPRDASSLVGLLQGDAAGHEGLRRRAMRAHERLLQEAARDLPAAVEHGDFERALGTLARACIPALPYIASTAFVAREHARLHPTRAARAPTVALVGDALDGGDGVTRLYAELRARGVPGWEVDVIGTDTAVDRRLPSAAEVELPYYAGRRVGAPSLVGLAEALTSRPYELVQYAPRGRPVSALPS